MKSRWNDTRKISQRWVITGQLLLLTPARFGTGKASQTTDMPILRDPATHQPLLPGSSIAGAMRAYLNEWMGGYDKDTETYLTRLLFGQVEKEVSYESFLVVDDAHTAQNATELRPGVKIDPATRTVKEDKNQRGQLYDMELLQPGTKFDLCFELDIPEGEAGKDLKQALAVALTGFEKGEIGLGARKRRGFGECEVKAWSVECYDLKEPDQLLAWLGRQPGEKKTCEKKETESEIAGQLGVTLPNDQRKRFIMQAFFQLDTSLLIRSASADLDAPDMTHLRNGQGDPVLSGTSLAGALRARALRIAKTFEEESDAKELVNNLFGPDEIKSLREREKGDEPFASHAVVRERVVEGRKDLVQSRIKIDRFTGGTFPGALFEQQPLVGGEKSTVEVSVELRNPTDLQVGLLLNLLKDLWTGDLPLGSEASVGRGRLSGRKAILEHYNPDAGITPEHWVLTPGVDQTIQVEGSRDNLESFVSPQETRDTAGGKQ